MGWTFRLSLLFAAMQVFGLQAQAQILFLDTNNSKNEIDIVRAFAVKQKQELTVLRGEENELLGKIDQYLSMLEQSNQTLKIFIASGHSNGEMFFGASGRIQNEELAAVLEKHSRDDLKMVILLGCYTNTPGNLFKHWLKLFPSAGLIAGYESIGASNRSLPGLSFLKTLLENQNSFLQLKSDSDKLKLIQQLNLFRGLNASLYLRGSYFSNEIKDSMENLKEMCKAPYREDLQIQYRCYWKGEAGCETPPANTHASVLRDFYKYIQLHAHCSEQINERYPWVSDIVSLIHYRNVVANFMKSESAGIQILNQDLRLLNLDPQLQFGDLLKLSRAQVIQKLQAVNQALGLIRDQEETTAYYESGRFNYVMQAIYNAELISKHIIDFSQAPLDWVEPQVSMKSDFPLDRAVDREAVDSASAWGYMLRAALYQEFWKEPQFRQSAAKIAAMAQEVRILEAKKSKLKDRQKETLNQLRQKLADVNETYQSWVTQVFQRAMPRLKQMVEPSAQNPQVMNHYRALEVLQYQPATVVLSDVFAMRK